MAQKPANWDQMSHEDKAMWDYMNAGNEFIEGGAAHYNVGDALKYQDLDPSQIAQLKRSEMEGISTDPRLQNAQYDALRQLEEQSKDGLTARDKADMAKLRNDVNMTSAGRMGAIKQNMAARGMSGSGMDMVAQMAAEGAATDREALASLEQGAIAADRRSQGARDMGSMSTQMRSQEFGEKSAKAQAQDAINRFNTANSVQAQFQNNQGQNSTARDNWGRTNETNDNNTSADYSFRKDKLGVGQGNAQMAYNKAAEDYNRAQARKARKGDRGQRMFAGAAQGAGTGFAVGGPWGAALGGVAGAAANYAHGGIVPGKAPFEYDDEGNDIFAAQLSPGEIVIPRSLANDPMASAKFVAAQNEGMDPLTSKYLASQDMPARQGYGASGSWGDEEVPPTIKKPRSPMAGKGAPADNAYGISGSAIKDLGEAEPSMPITASPSSNAPISPRALDALAKTNPGLVEEYRKRMAENDKEVASAEENQKWMGAASGFAKMINDSFNNKKEDAVLMNSFQNMGNAPKIIEANRPDLDMSALDKLGAQGVASAKEKRALGEDRFFKEEQLGSKDKANAKEATMNDPNSAESIAAREYLKQIAPGTAKMAGFENLSAAQIEQRAPGLYKAFSDTQNREQQKLFHDQSNATQRRGQDIRAGIAAGKIENSNSGNAGGEQLSGIPERLWKDATKERKTRDEHIKATHDAIENAKKMAKIGGIEGNLSGFIGGKSEEYDSLRANVSAAVVGRVPGIRSDSDYRNIVVPMLPKPTDTAQVAEEKVETFKRWLDSQTPETPILKNYGKDTDPYQPEATNSQAPSNSGAKPSWAK